MHVTPISILERTLRRLNVKTTSGAIVEDGSGCSRHTPATLLSPAETETSGVHGGLISNPSVTRETFYPRSRRHKRSSSAGPNPILSLLSHFSIQAWSPFNTLGPSPLLPAFPPCWRNAMAASSQYAPYPVPSTPRVISPSPTPSESGKSSKDSYFGPMTRSLSRASSKVAASIGEEESYSSASSEPENRARSRSRPAATPTKRGHVGRQASKDGLPPMPATPSAASSRRKPPALPVNDKEQASNGHLSPTSAYKSIMRELSRSPSPLGLIPIHREWRSFVSFFDSLFHVHMYKTKAFYRFTDTKSLAKYFTYRSASSYYCCTVSAANPTT